MSTRALKRGRGCPDSSPPWSRVALTDGGLAPLGWQTGRSRRHPHHALAKPRAESKSLAGPPLRGSALLTSPSRPGHHAASTETHLGGLAKQGLALRPEERLPWTLVLSLLPALDRHLHQGRLRGGRPRPSAALTAGPFHTAVLALPVYCHRGWKSPGMPPWSSGFWAYAPCPHCRGTPSSSG